MEPCNSDIDDQNNFLQIYMNNCCPTGNQSLIKKALSENISAQHSYMHVHISVEMYYEWVHAQVLTKE